MPGTTSYLAISVFLIFVGFTLGLSFWLGRKAKTASGYFAAHGQVGWFVNGIAFAGDYLSAASFLGICGMIAFYGYDGFLYSIGFLAGWVVALFVIAEPIKRLGKYTFADALAARFGQSRGITLAAAISTLVVSVLYLIPQMVGAGSLIKPLLGIEHYWGVIIVGGVVIAIVVTAGMISTTWVQFIKGSMLVVFCAFLVIAILARGITPNIDQIRDTDGTIVRAGNSLQSFSSTMPSGGILMESPHRGSLGPIEFLAVFTNPATKVANIWKAPTTAPTTAPAAQPNVLMVPPPKFEAKITSTSSKMVAGEYFTGVRTDDFKQKLNFISLMLALFCGTASLPHILIRYYTVKDAASARKSTVVGIIAIGFFYVLTLFVGLGAMISGELNSIDTNMAAPLLAKSFGNLPFALISAIAFTTVLGTVSGLILAASGAVAHDIIESVMGHKLHDHVKVGAAKWAAMGVGVVAIALGIACKGLNASFLVGWAFNVAASANLPAIVMLLFWNRTTRQGMIASILVGTFSSLIWLLLTKEAFQNVYGLKTSLGLMPFSQPAIVTIPLSFMVLVLVSLVTNARTTSR